MIFATDKSNNTILIDYASKKSIKVVRSVFGAKSFTLTHVCDSAILIQHEPNRILQKTLKMTVLTD